MFQVDQDRVHDQVSGRVVRFVRLYPGGPDVEHLVSQNGTHLRQQGHLDAEAGSDGKHTLHIATKSSRE